MFKQTWFYRNIFIAMLLRDMKAKYQNTHLSFLWLLLKPFLIISALYVVFSNFTIFNLEGDSLYVYYVLLGLLPWLFFSQALISCSESFLNAAYLMKKVYFPRIYLPLTCVVLVFVESIISYLILFVVMFSQGLVTWDYLFYSIMLYVLVAVLSFSLGLIVAILNVWVRDLRYLLPFFLQIGIFITPIFYKQDILSVELQRIFSYNPFVVILDLIRSVLGTASQLSGLSIIICLITITILFVLSLKLFCKLEERMVDVI